MKPRSCFISIIVLSLIFSSFSFSTGTEQEPTAFAFKGEGDKVTENFLLDPGAAIFNFCHEGNANFLVKLFDWEGDLVGLLVDEIGHFEGEVLVRIRSQNKFVLKITADGD